MMSRSIGDGLVLLAARGAAAGTLLLLGLALAAPARGQGRVEEMLLRRTAALQSQVKAIDAQIVGLHRRMPTIENEIDRLAAEIDALKVPDPQEEVEEPPKIKPRDVTYRTPLEQEVEKNTPIALICKNDRVAILDLDQQAKNFEALLDDREALEKFVEAKGGMIPAGDFDVKVTLVISGSSVYISQELVAKPGRPGESVQGALRPSSTLLRRLGQLDAENDAIQFAVYPDSFSVFRDVRQEVWKRKFGVTWVPMRHGEKVGIGDGPITEQ